MSLARPQPGTQRGVAMVEFTIVLPVILLLMFGVTELGRAMLQYNTLTKAVRDGVRHAAAHALFGATGTVEIEPWLEAEVENLVVYGNTVGSGQPLLDGLTTSQVTLSEDGSLQVRVDAAYPYSPVFGSIPSFGFGSPTTVSFTMSASARMRAL